MEDLAKAYMDHANKIKYENLHTWVRTSRGWCHATRKESLEVSEQMRKLAFYYYRVFR